MTQKIANEKAQHAKDMQIKEVQLQIARKQLESYSPTTLLRESTPVGPPQLSDAFNDKIEELEEDRSNQDLEATCQ